MHLDAAGALAQYGAKLYLVEVIAKKGLLGAQWHSPIVDSGRLTAPWTTPNRHRRGATGRAARARRNGPGHRAPLELRDRPLRSAALPGRGGKKRVYLAHDKRLDRDVAFALIKTERLDEVGRERIVREAQAMGRMGAQPRIVGIYEIGEEAGAPYVVTDLMGGRAVEALLAEGTLPLARTLEIAKGVTRALPRIEQHEPTASCRSVGS